MYNMDSGWHLEGVDGSAHGQRRLLEWTDSLLTREEPRAGKWKDLARSAQRVDGREPRSPSIERFPPLPKAFTPPDESFEVCFPRQPRAPVCTLN